MEIKEEVVSLFTVPTPFPANTQPMSYPLLCPLSVLYPQFLLLLHPYLSAISLSFLLLFLNLLITPLIMRNTLAVRNLRPEPGVGSETSQKTVRQNQEATSCTGAKKPVRVKPQSQGQQPWIIPEPRTTDQARVRSKPRVSSQLQIPRTPEQGTRGWTRVKARC